MVESDLVKEKRFRTLWDDKRYQIVGRIKRDSPKKSGDGKNGLDVLDLSDFIGLSPQDTQSFLEAMIEWGANIFVRKNRVFAHDTLVLTSGIREDLLSVDKIVVCGEPQPVPGYQFGIISDTHFGSTMTNLGALKAAYRYFESKGIDHVFHLGNLLAGVVPRKYRHADIVAVNIDDQLEMLKKGYPRSSRVKTHYLIGHTDFSFENNDIHPASLVEAVSESEGLNLDQLGMLEADLVFNPEGIKPFRVRLTNDKLNYYYSRSYQPQKKIENMAGGTKPSFWLVGGTQQLEELPRYAGVELTAKIPGMQNQTSRMRHRAYACDVGWAVAKVALVNGRPELYLEKFPVHTQNISVKGGLRE